MKLSQLVAFVAIAETGSFTKAADRLSVTQSAVSHAIRGLEEDLQVGVMRRDRGGVALTEVGQRILRHARSVIEHAEQIKLEARILPMGPQHTSRLIIGANTGMSARLLPRLIAEFMNTHKGVDIVLREGTDQQLAGMLRERTVDVGLVGLPKKDLHTVPLLEDELCVFLRSDHPLSGMPSLPVWQLADVPLILPSDGIEPVVRGLATAAGADITVAHRIQDMHVLLSMVSEGIGVSVLPALALPTVAPALRAVPLAPAYRRHLALGLGEAAAETPVVTELVQCARRLVEREEWWGVTVPRESTRLRQLTA